MFLLLILIYYLLVGKYRTRKSKSEPSFYLGGEFLFITKVMVFLCFLRRSTIILYLQNSIGGISHLSGNHVNEPFMWVQIEISYYPLFFSFFHQSNALYLNAFFFVEAKMEYQECFYITSKWQNLILYFAVGLQISWFIDPIWTQANRGGRGEGGEHACHWIDI